MIGQGSNLISRNYLLGIVQIISSCCNIHAASILKLISKIISTSASFCYYHFQNRFYVAVALIVFWVAQCFEYWYTFPLCKKQVLVVRNPVLWNKNKHYCMIHGISLNENCSICMIGFVKKNMLLFNITNFWQITNLKITIYFIKFGKLVSL